MNKYKDSFETRSESLEQGGRGIMTAVTNEDIHAPDIKRDGSKPYSVLSTSPSAISPIRTLADDLEQSVKDNNITLSGQALAQEDDRENNPNSERELEANQHTQKHRKEVRAEKRRIPRSLVFLVFALIVFGTSLYLFTSRQGIVVSRLNLPRLGSFFNEETAVDPTSSSPTLLVRADEIREFILTSGMNRVEARELLDEASQSVPVGTLITLTLTEAIETEEGIEMKPADIDSFLDIINPSIGNVLTRNISKYTLGVSGGGEARSFLVAEIISYEETFGALLSWERTMARELYGFFHNDGGAATSSDALSFSDTMVAGLDARVLTRTKQIVNEDGSLTENDNDVLIYALINKETLIITHSREELARIISRLQ